MKRNEISGTSNACVGGCTPSVQYTLTRERMFICRTDMSEERLDLERKDVVRCYDFTSENIHDIGEI